MKATIHPGDVSWSPHKKGRLAFPARMDGGDSWGKDEVGVDGKTHLRYLGGAGAPQMDGRSPADGRQGELNERSLYLLGCLAFTVQ